MNYREWNPWNIEQIKYQPLNGLNNLYHLNEFKQLLDSFLVYLISDFDLQINCI